MVLPRRQEAGYRKRAQDSNSVYCWENFERFQDRGIVQNSRLQDTSFKIRDSEILVKFCETLKISGTIHHPLNDIYGIIIIMVIYGHVHMRQ